MGQVLVRNLADEVIEKHRALALSETRNAPLVAAHRRSVLKVAGTPFAQRTVHLSATADRP